MAETTFRAYQAGDREACLAIFDANCPEYFAENERDEYAEFLDAMSDGYEVCEVGGLVVAAFGLLTNDDGENRLCWIMLDPNTQGGGLGTAIMQHVISRGGDSGMRMIEIAASHKSAPFFARFGARKINYTEDGWGPGMHRIDMELEIAAGE